MESLSNAIRNNRCDDVDSLIDAGYDVNQLDQYELSPIQIVCRLSNFSSIALFIRLVNAGANVKCRDYSQQNLMHLAAKNCHDPSFIKLLYVYGVDPNEIDINNQTPLMIACNQNYSLDVIKTLASITANINQRDIYGRTALWTSCNRHRKTITRILLKYGADPNVTDDENKDCFDVTTDTIKNIIRNKTKL